MKLIILLLIAISLSSCFSARYGCKGLEGSAYAPKPKQMMERVWIRTPFQTGGDCQPFKRKLQPFTH